MTDAPPRRLVALLDRDGTIIVDKVFLKDPDAIEFAPGAIEGLRLLRDAGFALVLVTNQSGVARGYFDEATVWRVHERLEAMLAAEGLRLAAIYYCPHGPNDGCACRKPAPGMALAAMRDLRLSAGSSGVHRRQRSRHGRCRRGERQKRARRARPRRRGGEFP